MKAKGLGSKKKFFEAMLKGLSRFQEGVQGFHNRCGLEYQIVFEPVLVVAESFPAERFEGVLVWLRKGRSDFAWGFHVLGKKVKKGLERFYRGRRGCCEWSRKLKAGHGGFKRCVEKGFEGVDTTGCWSAVGCAPCLPCGTRVQTTGI